MHIEQRSSFLLLIFLAVLLAGCSPVYKKSYTYIPPENSSERACLNTCLSMKQACRSDKDREYSDCRARAADDYANCMAFRVYDYPDGRFGNRRCVSNCYCNRDYCSYPEYDSCEDIYAECYRNCGGQVMMTEECVRFCK